MWPQLEVIVNGRVEVLGKKKKNMKKAIAAFPSSNSAVLLLRGDIQAPPALGNISVDAVIHWGFPSGDLCKSVSYLKIIWNDLTHYVQTSHS